MTTIHVQRIGTSPGYRAWIHGQHDWCYGFGCTWAEAVGDLLHTFEATLGLGIHVSVDLDPRPLDGLAAENASGIQDQGESGASVAFAAFGAIARLNAKIADPELAERAADWEQVP